MLWAQTLQGFAPRAFGGRPGHVMGEALELLAAACSINVAVGRQ